MKKHEKGHFITEKSIQKAIRVFRIKGGLIRKLPDEIVPPHLLVGANLGAYEPIGDYLYGGGRD